MPTVILQEVGDTIDAGRRCKVAVEGSHFDRCQLEILKARIEMSSGVLCRLETPGNSLVIR